MWHSVNDPNLKSSVVPCRALNLLANQQFDHVVIEEFVDSFLQAVCHSLSAAAEESIASISRYGVEGLQRGEYFSVSCLPVGRCLVTLSISNSQPRERFI